DVGFCVFEMKFEGDRAVDYRFIEVNPAFERLTGLADAEGRWMRDLAPAHEQYWFDVYGQVARTGEPFRGENHAQALGRWYDVHAYRVGELGENRVAALFNDISERKVAEAALRESEARFRLIADSAPVPMWMTRLDRTREFANRAYVEFLGLPYEEALAFDWRHIIHPDDIARIYAEQVGNEAALKPFTLEARYRNAAGHYRWIRSESQPRWDANGEHAGFVGVAYDVTIAKQSELELQAQVEERTAELRQAQKMEAVGQLTGGIAHDFNNLLTPIMGSLDILRRRLGSEDARAQRTIDTALQATERAATLVQRLLAFARRQDLQARAVDVADLLAGMDDLLARSLGASVRVAIDAPTAL
ncbi:MAG: hybrid sensor histidine kinase/response regulator, partial [Candidatus Accumulibacter sp.]|nr:hybrid sensor histidine kinase/response regulator [Accumulibacter sp.]